MNWPKRIIFVRHAQSQGNLLSPDDRAKLNISTYAYDLTELGVKQAEITGRYIRQTFGSFDAYLVSQYKRTQRTMDIIFPQITPYEDPRLNEVYRGIWHAMTTEQIARRFPEEILRREREGLYHYRPLGGENWTDVEQRIRSFMGALKRNYEGKSVFITGHGNWLILFQRLIHYFPIEEAIRRYHDQSILKNASVFVYEEEKIAGKSRLVLRQENLVPWEGLTTV